MYIDLTGVATAFIAGVFTIASVVIPMIISSHMKDAKAAAVLSNAVQNALGAIRQAAIDGNKPPDIKDGIDYVVNQAGPERERFAITRDAIEAKIKAKQGLQSLAVETAQATPVLDSVPVMSVGDADPLSHPLYRYSPS